MIFLKKSNRTSRALLVGFMLLSGLAVHAQNSVRDTVISLWTVDFSVGAHSPAGDMATRFGENGLLGVSLHKKTKKNWVFGVEGAFLFGGRVKENVAVDIRTSQGFVIDQVGGFTELLVQERGMLLVGNVGKIYPLFGPNPNSGLVVRLGGGLLQHNIRLETRNNDVPQLEGEYLKGYDRLSNGFAAYQFVGYQYFGNKKRVNFTVGFEGVQGFTQSRRDFNFDLKRKDTQKRFDGLYGLKVSWSFAIYNRASDGYFY